jgi:hypothetical protein
MPDTFDLEGYLKHLKTQPQETIYAKYAKEVASLQHRLDVLEKELQFTENCVCREVSHLDSHNRHAYTLPHESKEMAQIFQNVIYDAIYPDFVREPRSHLSLKMLWLEHGLRRKADSVETGLSTLERWGLLKRKESQREMEEYIGVLERPEKEPQPSINVVEEGYSCWQFCRYDNLEESKKYLTTKECQK